MNKKIIRLTESQLHQVIKESVMHVLMENINNTVYNPNNLHIISTKTNVKTPNQKTNAFSQELYNQVALDCGYVQLSDGKFYERGYGMDEDGTVIDARQLVPLRAMERGYVDQKYQEALENDPRFSQQHQAEKQQAEVERLKLDLEKAKLKSQIKQYDKYYID